MAGDARLLARVRVAGEEHHPPRLDVDLRLGDGITAITGHSGAGKSTLLAAIAGLVRPSEGRIVLDGTVLFDGASRVSTPPHARRVALVFQSLALFPHLRAWENVAYGLPRARTGDRRQRALVWLARARVDHVADRRPATLSGGEAQRVALARALASEPRLLLLDEPFSALDATLREQLGTELRALVESVGIPALLVTHERADAARLAGQTIVLEHGRVVEPPAVPSPDRGP
jgi:molybdate transport system ATP-binding protein